MRALANFVMQGPYQALVAACILGALSQFVLPLALFCCGIIALCVLSRSDSYWLIVLIGTALVVYVSSLFVESRPGLETPVVLFLLVPLAASAKVLRVTQSQSLAIMVAAVFAALLAVSIQVVSGDAAQWWASWLEGAVEGVKGATYQGFEADGTLRLMNGLVAMMFGFAVTSSLLIGRWMQAALYNPGGFAEEFYRVRYPIYALGVLGVVLIVTALFSEALLYDLLLVFMMPFFFHGMAVLHCTVDVSERSKNYLLPPYLLLFVMPQYAIVGMAFLGMADIFLNFRKAVYKRKDHDSN
ncbi:hypothetical protein [Methylotuvimicrobium alcaliphilum]|uniref:Membrane protein n=1 Tax=Methylotuvimicrobium alcaliphilum (strain DSM 19304 / NCIMB 14124 / VKM B-2133 / 20Z) TaxID=1091494 RepID=G4SXX0_META2|nr:hypothetical protein [Methylotuvimicrobium alcaliphilum]CCE23164.1 putative membrane protein [Methylotuvimicrobium alcaliphilum 20Z]